MSTTPPLLGPLDDLTADQINRRFTQMMSGAELGHLPALDNGAFSRITTELESRPRLFTFIDLFCGAGGSSIGLTLAGGRLLLGANHSRRAIETHGANFRDADHLCRDLNKVDMRTLPGGADALWASVICTEISPSGGRKRRAKGINPNQGALLKTDQGTDKDVFEATRYTAQDVIRAAEVHRFPIVIVENVVEFVTDWELFGWWLDGMTILGYAHQIVSVSAAHVGDDTNPHAPQRRDRIYVVFNRRDVPKPDLTLAPASACDTCGPVSGVQWWKKTGALTASGRVYQVGKYGKRTGQYVYRCPNVACRHSIVTPLERPAASVIDFADLGSRICDRKANGERPLVAATLQRISRGLDLFADPAFLDTPGGSWNRGTLAQVTQPFRTRTTKDWEALVTPPGAFVDTARAHVRPTGPGEPLTTVAAGGNHHGIVVPYYRTGRASSTAAPFPTCTVKDRFGLAQGTGQADVMNAHYRMIRWFEQAWAQRFPRSYIMTGNGEEKTAQAGNAVATNVAQWLGERVAVALNRTAAQR